MTTVLLLSTVLAIVSAVRGQCDACFEQQCYTKHYLCSGEEGDASINNLANELYIWRYWDLIFFNTAINSKYKVKFHIRRYSFDTKTTEDYAPRRLADFAVDEIKNEIYILENSKEGVYRWTFLPYSLRTTTLGFPQRHYNKIEYKDKLYFTIKSEKGIFFYGSTEPKIVPGTENHYVEDFIVDKKNDFYFVTSVPTMIMKLWRIKSGFNNATEFSSGYIFLTLDKDGNAHFINTATHGAYRVDYETEQLHQVGAFQDSVNGIVFNRENDVIYKSSHNLYQLKRASQPSHCIVTDTTEGKLTISQGSGNYSQ